MPDFRLVRSQRLVLRAPTLDDEEALFAIHSDPETNRHNPAGPMPNRQVAGEMLRALVACWDVHGFGYWCVRLAGDPTVIGFSGVEVMEWNGRSILNLYYRLTPSAWGKGYATEAAAEAIKVGKIVRPDLPILARTRPPNIPSMRVAEKLGMKRTVWTPTRVVFEAAS